MSVGNLAETFPIAISSFSIASINIKPILLNNCKKVFFFSMLFGGGYEYLCSFIQEIALGTVSWSYAGTRFNFNGRTNLAYSLCWGFLGLLWLRKIYPKISDWIESFPVKIGKIATWILLIFMSFNMCVSSAAVWRYSKRINGVSPRNNLERFLDRNYSDSVLKFVYPNMKIIKW